MKQERSSKNLIFKVLIFIQFLSLSLSGQNKQEKKDSTNIQLEEVEISDKRKQGEYGNLRSVEGVEIYGGKKTEVILVKNLAANLATNNAREIFAAIPGINIWESDPAGIQLGIATRGLNPNRSAMFNMRQNGYDMTPDAIGYPDGYYTPPTEALDQVQLIRGAASLQYGPQFGGLVNFILKKGPSEKPFEFTTRNSVGSFQKFHTFNSAGGTYKNLNYYSFFQYKTGNGFRPNSHYDVYTGFVSGTFKINQRLSVTGEYTYMDYVTQQPGGLTYTAFLRNPAQSSRSRNWFAVNWNMASIKLDYKIDENNTINIRNFGFIGDRLALMDSASFSNPRFLERQDEIDKNRTLIADYYRNIGSEGRYLKKYNLFKNKSSFLIGYRSYYGITEKIQGSGNNSKNPDFEFLTKYPDKPQSFNYTFPNQNYALFSENVFNLTDKFSITPGLRLEYIKTGSSGLYYDPTTAHVLPEARTYPRSFLLLGIGSSLWLNSTSELFFNFSQNYRGITFTDLRPTNSINRIDQNLKDEYGFNSDMGIRGTVLDFLRYDCSIFYMLYNRRIGQTLEPAENGFDIYRLTSNIGASRHVGAEILGVLDITKLIETPESIGSVTFTNSIGLVDASYFNTKKKTLEGNQVEYSPNLTYRSGIGYALKDFKATIRYAYVSEQFSDADNTYSLFASPVFGRIPAYDVWDFSLNYTYKWLILGASINNITNNYYFTRRAESYPGPGIIPSEPRTFFFTLGLKI